MTPEQIEAFNASVGGYFTPSELLFVIAALTLTLAFTWFAWLIVSGYSGVTHNALGFGALTAMILRGAFVLALLAYFVR
jgi:integrating conjugative element protein (TIGR03758 family)